MKKYILLLLVLHITSNSMMAHIGGHDTPSPLWTLKNSNHSFNADFIQLKDNQVYFSDANHNVLTYNIADLSINDQELITNKGNWIQSINSSHTNSTNFLNQNWILLLGTLMIICILGFLTNQNQKYPIAIAVASITVLMIACNNKKSNELNSSASTKAVPVNSLENLRAVFNAFDKVETHHDEKYFYIASDGLPLHEMMTGITNWQQQVPIPQDYTGDNSWAIPLQPQLADEPLSTKNNFMKGAIAIAANGIPIFNPLNNRGEDANVIGELDRWGGHCGRADDYHYHLPPTHLQSQVGKDQPIAYALDGFPLFGETSETLDKNLGRMMPDGSYQYHAVKEYPYLIAAMRGQVEFNPRTKAPENEIQPQAKSTGIRPDLRPLRGAEITDFKNIDDNEFSLSYNVNGELNKINYSWNENGVYNFEFVNSDGTVKKETYKKRER